MKKNNSIDRTALMPNYAPAEFIPVKGKKSILWDDKGKDYVCLLYTSPSPRDRG